MLNTAPPSLHLWAIPLGGMGEIGLNMMAMRYDNDIIIIDAGLMFPDEEMMGVDIVIPDMTYLKENADCIRGLILTHGHEDQVGAVPYLLKLLDIPIYGTRLTLGLIKGKLKEHKLEAVARLTTVEAGQTLKLGAFDLEFIHVGHSIVDGIGLGITTPIGRIVYTADFKIDHTPVDGKFMDLYKFAEYGRRGTLALFSDSTNSEQPGYTLSEREISRSFEELFGRAKGKIIVSSFASNIHRIQQVIDTAAKVGRKVVLVGRSVVENCRIAAELGYLKFPPKMLIDLNDLEKYPNDQIVLITSGSQGEPMSALSRMALNDHKQARVIAGDMVIISARVIPGNEKAISRIINHFIRRGAEVIYEEVSEVHVSGHAKQEELKMMINLVQPKFFIPIHGEYHQLARHRKLALGLNLPEENAIVAEDGDIIELSESNIMISGKVPAGRVFVDGKSVGEVGEVVMRDRQHLGADGMVVVILGIDKQTGNVLNGPDIISRGFVYEDESQQFLGEAKQVILDMIGGLDVELKTDWSEIKYRIRSALKKFIQQRMDRQPMILPIIMEI